MSSTKPSFLHFSFTMKSFSSNQTLYVELEIEIIFHSLSLETLESNRNWELRPPRKMSHAKDNWKD